MRSDAAKLSLTLVCLLLLAPHAAHAAALDIAKKWSGQIEGDLTADFMALRTELGGGSEAESLTNLGVLSELAEHPVGACWAFAGAVVASPTDANSLNNLGFALLQISQDDDAIVVLEEALRREKRAAFYNNLARAYLHKGDCKSALDTIRRAIALEPGKAQWHMTRNDIVMGCPELMRSPGVIGEATTGTSTAIEDDLDEVLGYTLRAIDKVDEDLLGDIDRCMRINDVLAERARAGVADGTYTEKDDERFEHANRALERLPDEIRRRNEQTKTRLQEAREAVKQANYMLIPFQHDMFLAQCIASVIGHCFEYETIHRTPLLLDSLFWTDLFDESDDEISESYWMEHSSFAPHLYEWCDRWVAFVEEKEKIYEECRAQNAAPGVQEARIDAAEKRYYTDVAEIVKAIYDAWAPWSEQTENEWQQGVARWIADKLFWVAVARNCEYYLVPRFLTANTPMPGASLDGMPQVYAPFLMPKKTLIESASLGGQMGLANILDIHAKFVRQQIEWCEPKKQWPVTVNGRDTYFNALGELSHMESYFEQQGQQQQDSRSYGEIDAALLTYAIDRIGDAVMDRTIKLGDAKCRIGSDGTISYDAKMGKIMEVGRTRLATQYNIRTGAWEVEGRIEVTVASIVESFIGKDPRVKIAFKALQQLSPPIVKDTFSTGINGFVGYSSSEERSYYGAGYKCPLAEYDENLRAVVEPERRIKHTFAETSAGVGSMMRGMIR